MSLPILQFYSKSVRGHHSETAASSQVLLNWTLTADYRFVSGAGLPNFASSIGTFVFISFSAIESRPSSHT